MLIKNLVQKQIQLKHLYLKPSRYISIVVNFYLTSVNGSQNIISFLLNAIPEPWRGQGNTHKLKADIFVAIQFREKLLK
jgi:hypothetical protein